MDDASRERRIAQARTILNHAAFKAKGKEERQRVVETMVEKGLSLDDLRMLLLIKKETVRRTKPLIADRQNFALLDKGPLTMILLNLPPRDVLSVCQTDLNYAYVCDDPRIFEQLLNAHYPDALYTDDPHRQYVALTEGVETNYAMFSTNLLEPILKGERPIQLGKPDRPEDIPGWSLSNVDPDIVTNLSNNVIFLGWITPDQQQQFKILKRSVWNPNRKNESERGVKLIMPFINVLDPLFKSFAKEYRQKGLEYIIQIPRVQYSLSERYGHGNVGKFYLEATESQIRTALVHGRPISYKTVLGERVVFTIKGLAIPEGTIASSLIENYTWHKTVRVFKSKERSVAKFLQDVAVNLHRLFLNDFDSYMRNGLEFEEVRDLSDNDKMKTVFFNKWLNANYPELTALTEGGVRDYLLKYGGTKVADFHFLSMTF